ncbi:MAG TPA: CpsD/CapB family tyrosine-protein kinase [Terriglobia bacterium]|nr:CpsD/CapB family tyrosine-protein kinase [Terriglobia bacterium]
MTPARMIQLLSEEETKLIDHLFLGNGAKRMSVTFTAPQRHAGCTWLTIRTAQRLAERVEASVCLVDANLHWPAIHAMFGIPNERGLFQAAMQPDEPIRDFVTRVPNTNLWVVPSGGPLTDSSAILSSEAMKNRIAELAREFDYVLIDTPALKPCADSSLIGRLTDGVVLVIAANSSKRDIAVNAKMMLDAADVTILGAVLNRRTFPIPDRIYQYL